MTSKHRGFLSTLAILGIVIAAAPVKEASAIPVLQVYIEGATYDLGSETWLTTESNFNLWVVGSFNAGESIVDVRLSAAYAAAETGTISITSIQTSDPTVTDTDGSEIEGTLATQYVGSGASPIDQDGDGDLDPTPVMSDGGNLATHGIFGPNTDWSQWQLGDMVNDSETMIGDYQTATPTPTNPSQTGEIFAYNVSVTGYSSGVHFDAFNHVEPSQFSASVFAPYSHDAGTVVPEPGTAFALGMGLTLLGIARMRRRKKS